MHYDDEGFGFDARVCGMISFLKVEINTDCTIKADMWDSVISV